MELELLCDHAGQNEAARNLLMPLHLQVSDMGYIVHLGPTLKRIYGTKNVLGRRFLEVFEIKRPARIFDFRDLRSHGNGQIRMQFRQGPNYKLKGIFVHLPAEDRTLINLSLGVSVVDAVSRHGLTGADFAYSDPTVDMLYLIEAKTVALEESKRLNLRLQGAKTVAEEQAYTDTLTGLMNRRASDSMLGQLEAAEATFGLMHLDLDYFKKVNDTMGHAAGDYVLQHAAKILKAATRTEDMVARVGGDEFVLIFKDCVDLEVLNQIAARIISQLEAPIMFEGQECRISASIGTTLSSFYDVASADRMMSDADEALYVSKDKGRAQHTVFEPEITGMNRRKGDQKQSSDVR